MMMCCPGLMMFSAASARDQLTQSLLSAGLKLRKWISNEWSILEGLPLDHLIDAKVLTLQMIIVRRP